MFKKHHTEYKHFFGLYRTRLLVLIMPADNMEKQTASPIAGAPASGSHTPDKPKNASEHRKVNSTYCVALFATVYCFRRMSVVISIFPVSMNFF